MFKLKKTEDTGDLSGVILSEEAISVAVEMKNSDPEKSDDSLRVYLEGKGCSGFNYGVTFDKSDDKDIVLPQSTKKGDTIDLVIDKDTFEYVKGSHITWVDDERGKGFLVENPNHRKFRGKFYNSPKWKKKLQEMKAMEELPTDA